MTTYDVRNQSCDEITVLRIADRDSNTYIAELVIPSNGAGIKIYDSQDTGHSVVVKTKEHAANLRKALDKAEQMGWLK